MNNPIVASVKVSAVLFKATKNRVKGFSDKKKFFYFVPFLCGPACRTVGCWQIFLLLTIQ